MANKSVCVVIQLNYKFFLFGSLVLSLCCVHTDYDDLPPTVVLGHILFQYNIHHITEGKKIPKKIFFYNIDSLKYVCKRPLTSKILQLPYKRTIEINVQIYNCIPGFYLTWFYCIKTFESFNKIITRQILALYTPNTLHCLGKQRRRHLF